MCLVKFQQQPMSILTRLSEIRSKKLAIPMLTLALIITKQLAFNSSIVEQSPDIAQGVNESKEVRDTEQKDELDLIVLETKA